MSDATFATILHGKQSKFEEKVYVDEVLLSKLEDYEIITRNKRAAIEVTFATSSRIRQSGNRECIAI